MKISKKPFQIFMATTALVLALQVPVTYAASLSDLKNEKSEVEEQKDHLSNEIKEKSAAIDSIKSKQEVLLNQITQITDKITNTNNNINQVTQEIAVATQEIETLKADIIALQAKIDQRNELLAERARALQANGSVSFLDVLLGANSFVDFIDRYSAVNTLMDADRQIMKEQKQDQDKLEEQKLTLEKTKKELETKKAELDSLKASLNSQKKEKDNLIVQLEAQQKQIASEKEVLEEQYEEAVEISDEINAQIASEQKRLLEIARQQEAARKAAAANNSKNNGGGTSAPAVSAGNWTKPANGRYTSPYGARIHPISGQYKFHYGIDIANSTGTPVVSAADGVVSYAGSLSTFGNVVMVTHSIDGQIFTSVYAHLNSIHVGVGTQVSKGQQIAGMGNTGGSTGTHLHFEIHVGTWVKQSVGSVNPLNYISL
ncbi:peptidoglycan DD-metalloendopeptidase family protein [Ureibacillus chungkukjangi]|uniref:murein hydrolase activator EnvC family protein n=1 Tax=Ureibacillus chungkukjangi TaxID=1202712 RepID=UPI00384A6BAE